MARILERVERLVAQQELVELVRPRRKSSLYERQQQRLGLLAKRDTLDHLDPGHRPGFGRIPALLLNPVAQLVGVDPRGQLGGVTHLVAPPAPLPRARTRRTPAARA